MKKKEKGLNHFSIRGGWFAISNVFHDGRCKQNWLLIDETDGSTA